MVQSALPSLAQFSLIFDLQKLLKSFLLHEKILPLFCNIVFYSHEDRHLVAAWRSQAFGLRAGSVRRWQHMREAHVLPPPYNRMRASKTRGLIQRAGGGDGNQILCQCACRPIIILRLAQKQYHGLASFAVVSCSLRSMIQVSPP